MPYIRRWVREHPYTVGVVGTLIATGAIYAIEQHRITSSSLQGRVSEKNRVSEPPITIAVCPIPELPAEDAENPHNLIHLYRQLLITNKPNLLVNGTALMQAKAIWAWMHGPGKEEISRFNGHLDLPGYNYKLTSLSPVIGLFHNLSSLNLNFNNLTVLPPEIGKLTKLTRLHLAENRLVELPSTIGELRELDYLSLRHNQLKTLLPEMEQLANLCLKGLTGNSFIAFPNSFFKFDRENSFPFILANYWVRSGDLVRQDSPWPVAQILMQYASASNEKRLSIDTMLMWLNRQNTLNIHQKIAVLKELVSGTPDSFLQKLVDLRIVVDCNRADLLQIMSFQKAADTALETFLPDLDLKRYSSQFGPYRNPNALRIYAGKIAIANLENSEVIESFKNHIRSVLNGSYKINRYALTDNPHLSKIAEKFSGELEKWKQNIVVPLLADVINPGSKENLKVWLYQLLVLDKALGDMDEYPELRDFVVEGNKDALQTLRTNAKLNRMLSSHEREKTSLQYKICRLFDPDSKVLPLEILQDLSSSNALFLGKEIFHQKICSKMEEIREYNCLLNYTVHNTDDFRDFLFLKEAEKACLSYDGHTTDRTGQIVNQSLLALWHHGQTRLMAVKDEKGRIMSAAFLRLLWNGERPVLYAEKIHYTKDNQLFKEAIIEMIQRSAADLDCPIFITDSVYKDLPFNQPSVDHPLLSLGGPAPFDYLEYFWSELIPNGEFQIS